MKKLFLLLFVLGVAFYQADAQSCSKAKTAAAKAECAKTCASKAKQTKVASASAEAILAAEQAEDIEAKTCEVSGKTAFYKKSVCAVSGKESRVEVEYDADNKEFVKVASASMEAELEAVADDVVEEAAPTTAKAKSCAKSAKSCAKKCSEECAKDCCKGKKAELEKEKS